jgi:hypothetical protein
MLRQPRLLPLQTNWLLQLMQLRLLLLLQQTVMRLPPRLRSLLQKPHWSETRRKLLLLQLLMQPQTKHLLQQQQQRLLQLLPRQQLRL